MVSLPMSRISHTLFYYWTTLITFIVTIIVILNLQWASRSMRYQILSVFLEQLYTVKRRKEKKTSVYTVSQNAGGPQNAGLDLD